MMADDHLIRFDWQWDIDTYMKELICFEPPPKLSVATATATQQPHAGINTPGILSKLYVLL